MKLIWSIAGAVALGVLPISAVLVPGATVPLPSSTAAGEQCSPAFVFVPALKRRLGEGFSP
jgi:hypothetical protein